MLKFNNSIVPNKGHIGWHFSSNKYAYRDVYSALKSSVDNDTVEFFSRSHALSIIDVKPTISAMYVSYSDSLQTMQSSGSVLQTYHQDKRLN